METVDIDGTSYRYYVRFSKVNFDEDDMHEFKGHWNITKEQIPPNARNQEYDRPTRQPVSKTINAMLNTSTGGTIYIGISDDAKVHGLLLNQYKMDHIEQNVRDVLSMYSPKVPPHRYSVNFVPAIDKDMCDIKKTLLFDPRHALACVDEVERSHELWTYRPCWCHNQLVADTNMGIFHPFYVVEIVIHPWNGADPRNKALAVGKMCAHPIHVNEEGKAYRRCDSSIREFTIAELQALAVKTVVDYYDPIQQSLELERDQLIEEIHKMVLPSTAPDDHTQGTEDEDRS